MQWTRPPATRGERVCAFIETHCCVPEGTLVGKPMHLEDFERKFILDVYDNPYGTRTAILSIAKKNGKTPLIAAILLAHIAGPEARQNSQIVSGAMSQKQASVVFKYAVKMVQMSTKLAALVRIRPSVKVLVGLALNVEYSAISRQKKTAHGIAPVLVLLDELGQVRGPEDDFVDALLTALGAYDDGMVFVISTQAASDSDMLSVMIDDARESCDPHTVCHVYAAKDPECDVLDRAAWAEANPALGIFRSLPDLEQLAIKAKRMPSFEASFRNLNLNQRVETVNPLVSKTAWLANGAKPDPIAFIASPVWAGLDLSARLDLTAFIMVALYAGRWHVRCLFWTPAEGIEERSRRDRQPYALWRDRGLLRTTPGRTVDYAAVIRDIRDATEGMALQSIAFDRWRMDVFRKDLEREAFEPPMEPFGQGFKDMAPAIDELETILSDERMAHGNHPVLTMCAANAISAKDEAGNRKLDKKRATGRIDGMTALTMAIGIATSKQEEGDLNGFLSNPVT